MPHLRKTDTGDTNPYRPRASLFGVVFLSHFVIAMAASFLVCYLAGARGNTLLFAAGILTVLVHHGLAYWESNFAPLKIEPCPEEEYPHDGIEQDAELLREAERSRTEE